ncbi:hypothetical protein GH714_002234 [Hevea brasiliensis]|uniref:F-box associated domain-containing protein n=1 Tax=Hevea brasiliensis TaxID=3981 RepID=A0A6A6KWV4_HEVBR|nr:hypothetical protein GH714_002234 [Hevea brasiliensis]
MEVPDCLVKKYQFVDVAVFDGSLLLVASFKLTGEGCFTVWMMKEYGVPGSWTKLFDIPDFKSHLKWIRKLVAFRQSDEFTEVEASEDNGASEILEEVASSSNS